MTSDNSLSSGILYVVATPIGHLDDITFRAIQTLKTVDLVLAEDTRHSEKLLRHFGISTPLSSFHAFNETEKSKKVMELLAQGQSIALVSDAGTPLISDPGYPLIVLAKKNGFKVTPIPGACAITTALSVAGLPSASFIFQGFLPNQKKSRCKELEKLKAETRTIIFYEVPHRILSCLEDMASIFGPERLACLAREMTKCFESIELKSLHEHYQHLLTHPKEQKGEFVILIRGAEEQAIDQDLQLLQAKNLLKLLMKELPLKKAAQITAEFTGIKKNMLYEIGLKANT